MDIRPERRSAPRGWRLSAAAAAWLAFWWVAPQSLAAAPTVQSVEVQAPTERAATRVLLDLSAPAEHKAFTLDGPPRLVVDLVAAEAAAGLALPAPAVLAAASPVLGVRLAKRGAGLRLVVDLAAATPHRTRFVPAAKGRLARLEVELGAPVVVAGIAPSPPVVVDAAKLSLPEPVKAAVAVQSPKPEPEPVKVVVAAQSAVEPPRADSPRLNGARTRQPPAGRDLVIAVDAGHGGKDPGAHGLNGTQEKDVTLAVARRLAVALQREPGMRAYLVRDDDYYVDLRQRMVRARKAGADLFISIHADAAHNRAAAGSSVYILSTRGASSEAARWLADRENAADLAGGVQLDKVDPTVASVLMDLSQGDTITASDRAARLVLNELDRIGNVHKREVQAAGFMVLKSPDIPSVLVETAFISHPAEEARLADPEHQQRLAEAIQNGIRAYFYSNPPPGTRVAQLAAARREAGRMLAAGP